MQSVVRGIRFTACFWGSFARQQRYEAMRLSDTKLTCLSVMCVEIPQIFRILLRCYVLWARWNFRISQVKPTLGGLGHRGMNLIIAHTIMYSPDYSWTSQLYSYSHKRSTQCSHFPELMPYYETFKIFRNLLLNFWKNLILSRNFWKSELTPRNPESLIE